MVRYPLNDPVHTRILRGGRGGVCIAVYIAVCAGSTHAMLSDRLPFEHLRHQVRWIRCVAFPPGSHRAAPTKPTAAIEAGGAAREVGLSDLGAAVLKACGIG